MTPSPGADTDWIKVALQDGLQDALQDALQEKTKQSTVHITQPIPNKGCKEERKGYSKEIN
jgi:hypothetical protein